MFLVVKKGKNSLKTLYRSIFLHFRITSYKGFLQDIRYFLEQGQLDDVKVTINAFSEALDKRQNDIKLADSSPAGWSLVDRSEIVYR